SVTPYRIGHFPLMAYYQIKDGVSPINTLTGLVKCQVVYSITSIIVYTGVVITLAALGSSVNFNGRTVNLWYVIGLGLGFHIGAFILTVFLAFNLPLQRWVLKITAKAIGKFKKSFDKQKFIDEKSLKLQLFKEQIKIIGKKFYYYLIPSSIYAIYMVFSGSAPYLCYLLISGAAFNIHELLTFYVLYLSSAYITNIVPVPGGAGASEVVFKMIFESVIASATIGSVLVLWRASTFYFAVIIEIAWYLAFTVVKTVKLKKADKGGDKAKGEFPEQ
ncbi:MAG: lysylphosphatidylglycerol synthase domain-containing protein, partial [Clostridia bacterium]|nr:lysylphosphatidylglycerol synthase domain-containing protein [Clostridia bacterium]